MEQFREPPVILERNFFAKCQIFDIADSREVMRGQSDLPKAKKHSRADAVFVFLATSPMSFRATWIAISEQLGSR